MIKLGISLDSAFSLRSGDFAITEIGKCPIVELRVTPVIVPIEGLIVVPAYKNMD
jgi:hypothetical protein